MDSVAQPEPAQHLSVHHRHAATPPPRLQRTADIRGAAIPLLVGLLIGSIFVAVYLAAFHDPKPHDLSVAVVAPQSVVTRIEAGSAENDDAFNVHSYDAEKSAVDAVRAGDEYGALVVGRAEAELFVAGANGPSVTQTLQGAFGAVTKASGTQLQVTDVKPLASGDSRGLSVFYGAFGVVLAAFLFGLTSMQVGATLPALWRAVSAVAFALLAGLVVAWLLGPVFHALPAPFGLTFGVVGLLALAIASSTAALLKLFGPAGTLIASVLLLVFGNATSTGILPAAFLPGWLEALTPVLPVGVAVQALRGGAYFQNHGVGTGVAVLLAWSIVAASLFVLAEALRGRRTRSLGEAGA